MSLDTIKLTSYLCQSMFTKSLVAKDADPEKSETIPGFTNPKKNPETSNIKSLGKNRQQTVFVVNDKENLFLADEDMKLLTDLLMACKLSMLDIALINFYSNPDLNFGLLCRSFQAKKVLAFGISGKELGLSFEVASFEIKNVDDQIFMSSPSLAKLRQDISLKKQLWASLKTIFQLK